MTNHGPTSSRLDLSGRWKLELRPKPGFEASEAPKEAVLPGTLDECGAGVPLTERHMGTLRPDRHYEGIARYSRRITIPESWNGKRCALRVGRTRILTIRVDGVEIGVSAGLSNTQEIDLGDVLVPGERRIELDVSNAHGMMASPSVRNSHLASVNTQTNWLGILGEFAFEATNPIRVSRMDVYPDLATAAIKVKLTVVRPEGRDAFRGRIRLSAEASNSERPHTVPEKSFNLELPSGQLQTVVTLDFPMGADFLAWDEFAPNLYQLTASLDGLAGPDGSDFTELHAVRETFGMREFAVDGSRFKINGATVLLRGKHDACVFPLTAYAPMDIDSWRRLFKIAKSYGVNHYRFHSWCPPEAAFAAADLEGLYLQPELPSWNYQTAFEDDEEYACYREEALHILKSYGNHPSFVMFGWGNELVGSMERLEELVVHCRTVDPRRLYTIGSNCFLSTARLPRKADYWTTFWTEGQWNFKTSGYGGKHVRGCSPHHTRGHINNDPPATDHDYIESIRHVPMPVIGHETGQYQIHPDFEELEKYTGVLKPVNLELFKDQAVKRGILPHAKAFQAASGALAVRCYREEIEAALRTPGMGGFQLLDLQDFPGQGTALVGILDSFMDSKGLVTPESWRRFCGPTIPLLRMPRYVWTWGEEFHGEIQIAHYGPRDIAGAEAVWIIRDASDQEIASGKLAPKDVVQGGVTSFGKFHAKLAAKDHAERLSVEIEIAGHRNDYPIWSYPEYIDTSIPSNIFVARALDGDLEARLLAGARVFLIPEANTLEHSVGGAFIPDVWCYSLFKKYDPPGTLGIVCDQKHPALTGFPTAYHADWQWWRLLKTSNPVVLDDCPKDLVPIIYGIDNIVRMHRLALLFEVKVGKGALLVCSIDLLSGMDRPEFRRLFRSLADYAAGSKFAPATNLDLDRVKDLLRPRLMAKKIEQCGDMFG